MLASDAPVTYQFEVGRKSFTGRVENFYAPSVYYRSFLKEGAKECGEGGSINFQVDEEFVLNGSVARIAIQVLSLFQALSISLVRSLHETSHLALQTASLDAAA